MVFLYPLMFTAFSKEVELWKCVFKKKKFKKPVKFVFIKQVTCESEAESLEFKLNLLVCIPRHSKVFTVDCRGVECFHQIGCMVVLTVPVIDLQKPDSAATLVQAFKLHWQIFFAEALISCSHSVTVIQLRRGYGGSGVWVGECGKADAFNCLCTFAVMFWNILTRYVSTCRDVYPVLSSDNIMSSLIRGQEIFLNLIFDIFLQDHLIIHYLKISEGKKWSSSV